MDKKSKQKTIEAYVLGRLHERGMNKNRYENDDFLSDIDMDKIMMSFRSMTNNKDENILDQLDEKQINALYISIMYKMDSHGYTQIFDAEWYNGGYAWNYDFCPTWYIEDYDVKNPKPHFNTHFHDNDLEHHTYSDGSTYTYLKDDDDTYDYTYHLKNAIKEYYKLPLDYAGMKYESFKDMNYNYSNPWLDGKTNKLISALIDCNDWEYVTKKFANELWGEQNHFRLNGEYTWFDNFSYWPELKPHLEKHNLWDANGPVGLTQNELYELSYYHIWSSVTHEFDYKHWDKYWRDEKKLRSTKNPKVVKIMNLLKKHDVFHPSFKPQPKTN